MQCNKIDYVFSAFIFILTIFSLFVFGCSENSTEPTETICIETTDNQCKDTEGETIFKVY